MEVLAINNLTKKYGPITAINNLSLSVQKGNIYGFLGPNGSGKTTTLGIILGILHQNSGDYTWFQGKYGTNARRHLGALLETPNFYPYMSAEENLKLVAHIKKVKNPRISELLTLVDLTHRKNYKFRTYSLGMKQRLAIAAAMIGDPELLIFDEPTNGLDPQGIAEVRNTIIEIANRGKTILMASHMLDEVEKVCSHVAIIKRGSLLATGPVGSILNNDKLIEIGAENMAELALLLESHQAIRKIDRHDDFYLLAVDPNLSSLELNQLAFQKGITLTHLAVKQKSLESEFLEITK